MVVLYAMFVGWFYVSDAFVLVKSVSGSDDLEFMIGCFILSLWV